MSSVYPQPQPDSSAFIFTKEKAAPVAFFSDTGNHYNPTEAPHPSHSGDLPPLMLCNGGVCQSVTTNRFKVQDIIGRTVIIHNMPDDFSSQPSGNAGIKIACGVIRSV